MASIKKEEVRSNISIENARIGFRNFTGKETQFNLKGRRNFCVFLDEELSKTLVRDGWNVKFLEPREPDEPRQAYLPVGVSYSNYSPTIYMFTNSSGRTLLDETTVHILDWADIGNVDLIIRPYNWEVAGKNGVKAYLKTMYITVIEDEFASKYKNLPIDDSSFEEDDIPF